MPVSARRASHDAASSSTRSPARVPGSGRVATARGSGLLGAGRIPSASRRHPPGTVDRPVQRQCRGRADRRPLSPHRRTGLPLFRAGARVVLRDPGRRPRCRGDERQCRAHGGERWRPHRDLGARSRPRRVLHCGRRRLLPLRRAARACRDQCGGPRRHTCDDLLNPGQREPPWRRGNGPRCDRSRWPKWSMKTRSRDQGRTAGVGWVKRPSPGFGAMGETRRIRPLAGPKSSGKVRPVTDVQDDPGSAAAHPSARPARRKPVRQGSRTSGARK